MPLALGRPVWVDDPHFNLGYHLRRTALPAPGGDEELRNLVGRVMSQQLDRAQAAVGDVDGRGPRGGPLGAALQGAPLHGRRRLRHRPADGGPRRRARAGAAAARRLAARSASRPASSCSCDALVEPRARAPTTAVRDAPRAPRGPLPVRALETAQGGCSRCAGSCGPPRRPRSTARSARTAAGPGRARSSPTSRRSRRARRHGQRRRAHRDHQRLPRAAALARRVDRPRRCARSCRCRCARRRSAAPTTTASRRCSPSCRSGSRTRSSGSPRSARRWSDLKESKQAVAGEVLDVAVGLRAADAARARRARGHPRAAAQRQHGDHERARPAVPAVRGRPADARGVPVRSARPDTSASASRSSPTTAGSTSASPATTTTRPTSTCCARGSSGHGRARRGRETAGHRRTRRPGRARGRVRHPVAPSHAASGHDDTSGSARFRAGRPCGGAGGLRR